MQSSVATADMAAHNDSTIVTAFLLYDIW